MKRYNENNMDKEKIKQLRKQGLSYGAIGKMFGVSKQRIYQICGGIKRNNTDIERIYQSILERDNFECQWKQKCKGEIVKKDDLLVHHIDFNHNNNSEKNLITVCKRCHGYFHRKNHTNKSIEKKLNKKGKTSTKAGYNRYMRKYNFDKKEKEIKKKGGKCNCCGETKLEFLSIERKRGGKIFCHNCREYMAIHGTCPKVDKKI